MLGLDDEPGRLETALEDNLVDVPNRSGPQDEIDRATEAAPA
jgi:hypothetical protein